MPLTPGSRVGPYEIVAAIGKGGMGEVYRARDTRLHRDVAIKVLPPSFAADADRRMRFEREARTLAALNHPHIAQLHGLEESVSPDGSTFGALIMEMVEGPELSQRIAQGALPLDEALSIARQVADALDAAHEQGIVHRDLKPANIKLRPDGTVKVLDFGLAKAVAQGHGVLGQSGLADPAAGFSNPTITTPAMTHAGIILGTAPYMSPEQAKGKPVDKRADIWAFGCIVYEMLTGTLLFAGETVNDTIAEVLKKDIDLGQLPPSTPPSVRRVIARCLERDPRDRLRDIGDARVELNASAPRESAPSIARSNRAVTVAWALGAVAVASLALAGWLALRPSSPPSAQRVGPIHFAIGQPGLTVFPDVAISQDGTRIAFRAVDGRVGRLWTRALDTPVATPIPGTEGGQNPFWSPDGSELGFFNARGLVAVQLAGGLMRTISSGVRAPGGNQSAPTWAADGTIFVGGASLVRVHATTGAVTAIADGATMPYATPLPNGTHFIYTTRKTADANVEAIAVAPLNDLTQSRVLVDVPSKASYANGHLLYVRDGTLMAHRFDLARLELTGDPFPIADAVDYFRPNGRARFWAAANTVVYITHPPDTDPSVMDRTGTVLATFGQPGQYQGMVVSPDGTRAMVSLIDRRLGVGDVYMHDLSSRTSTRVTRDDASEGNTIWSLDGRSIVYGSDRGGGPPDLYLHELGSADARRIWVAPDTQYPRAWLPDGRLLVLDAAERSGNLVALTLGDNPTREILQPPVPGGNAASVAISPDGRWIAFSASDSGPTGRSEIFVQPLGRPGARVRVSRAGGVGPRWRRDGAELFFRIINEVMVTEVGKGEPLTFTPPRLLFSLDRPISDLDVTPDGQRFLVIAGPPPGFTPARVMVNWTSLSPPR